MGSIKDQNLLNFLEKRSSYPHNPETVQHIQTHISHVFIVPPFVYKLKKPVDFGFVDYNTLDKRCYYCEREVELNRRLCEDIYLEVVKITKNDGTYSFESTDEKSDEESVAEYAVKMRKLEDAYFLHRFIEDQTLTQKHLDRVADKLANFYTGQDEDLSKWGTIEQIKVNTDENFEQTEEFIGQTIDRNTFDTVKRFTNKYFRQHRDLFQQRIKDRRIVDGHGDLHLEHIHITPKKVRIYDCIEFNDRFRYGDLAADLAYLAMDLNFSGLWKEERYFVDQIAEKLDDPGLPKIIDFYKCYRAYVKGKVKSLQSAEKEVSEEDREKAAELARRYFNLSLYYALLGSQPTALIFMGRVGTGKSTLARHFSQKLNLERYSSDRIRKKLAGLTLDQRTPASKRKELYSASMSEKTYKKLLDKSASSLKKGKSVILDATFSRKFARKKLLNKLDTEDAQYLFIEMQASDETIKRRLQNRANQSGHVSDARLEDFDKLKHRYQPPEEIEADHRVQIATKHNIDDSINELYNELLAQNL